MKMAHSRHLPLDVTPPPPGEIYRIRFLHLYLNRNHLPKRCYEALHWNFWNFWKPYFLISVPSQPPSEVMVTGTSDLALNVEWQHVSWDNWNGEPVGTLIMFNSSQGDSGIFTVPYPETTLMITGLHPVTTYIITLCEVTRPGNGPCQQLKATTLLSSTYW